MGAGVRIFLFLFVDLFFFSRVIGNWHWTGWVTVVASLCCVLLCGYICGPISCGDGSSCCSGVGRGGAGGGGGGRCSVYINVCMHAWL